MLGNGSITEDFLSTTMCLVEQKLKARPLTPVSSDVKNLEAINPNHFLIGNKNVCLPYLPCGEEFIDHRKLFRQTQAYSNLIWDRFREEYLPTLNNRYKWKCKSDRNLNQADYVWLIEDSDKRGFLKLGRFTEIIKSSDGAIRSAMISTKDGVYRRPVVKLAPTLQIEEDVFTKENRAVDVEAALSQHA